MEGIEEVLGGKKEQGEKFYQSDTSIPILGGMFLVDVHS